MIKKLFLFSLIISQLAISCSSEDSPETTPTDETLAEQIATIMKQPYSKLTPAEQKVKLEAEANEMLVQLDKTKSSSAIDAIENLNTLLDISSVDIFNGKNDNEVEDIINVSGVYGVYTWNNAGQKWDKTASTTELKFVFPAKESQTSNNATFSTNSVSSDIKVDISDSYNWETNVETNDHIFLPISADAVLTIDNKEAATFKQTAKYTNGKEVPNEFTYKMTLNDGYTWEMSGSKATENISKASLTFNGKNLISFNSGSTANIDGLIDNDELVQYRGKANGLIQLMENFVIVADMDLATEASEEAALEKSLPKVDYQTKTYFTDINAYQIKLAQGNVANFNKNFKLILVSKKDGTKIADLVKRAEKGYSYKLMSDIWTVDPSYTNGGYWSYNQNGGTVIQYYDENLYLKFSDNTEVEMSAYFSEGFSTFETKFEDFIKAFEK
ncbi:hypothetical protein SGQ44_14755 [Flavobacterium sp. Fl-77]|uniref:Uncharacterized protein n=1 Tax=Flavobacterium flavipigmentatum TaxID=2893884 RepID=A0AAJ2SBC7_9FLAO|nr:MULTISPECIES: hypothetical protein [unclassified Flavobacterium]MDX6183576.1 hypothetical protein [Flavobacterium sp. Fl-33]MDX6187022.1 hypothetical protein [Flavobacterium sp. Fl-77]UFH40246.1 hypothetical protein LNP22_08195 [Flavobacterium sp. F-70]